MRYSLSEKARSTTMAMDALFDLPREVLVQGKNEITKLTLLQHVSYFGERGSSRDYGCQMAAEIFSGNVRSIPMNDSPILLTASYKRDVLDFNVQSIVHRTVFNGFDRKISESIHLYNLIYICDDIMAVCAGQR
jgi:hypothetical protein